LGSKFGGYFTDKRGYLFTLFVGLLIHGTVLVLISFFGYSAIAMYILLVLWTLSAWSSGPALQFNLIQLAPLATSIMFSLYTSIVQLGMAMGAMIGGIVIQSSSIEYVSWVGSVNVFISILLLGIFLRKHLQHNNTVASVKN